MDVEADAGFHPTAKQLAYLFCLRDACLPTGDKLVNDTVMADKVKVSRQTIYEWKQDPRFAAWLHGQMTGEHSHEWDLVLTTHHQLAIRGSVRSAEFLARVRTVGLKGGGFVPAEGDTIDNSIKNYSVVLLSPRPPALPAPGGGA